MPNDPEDFKNQNGMNNPDQDDFVGSSFAVQFKPGDKTGSVSDKLKESKENLEKKNDNTSGGSQYSTPDNGFRDEFDDFEFDASISAFKPFKAPEPEPAPAKPEEPKPVDTKPVEAKPVETAPAVNNSDPVFPKLRFLFIGFVFPECGRYSKQSSPRSGFFFIRSALVH